MSADSNRPATAGADALERIAGALERIDRRLEHLAAAAEHYRPALERAAKITGGPVGKMLGGFPAPRRPGGGHG